jgi:hypothetical protein
LLGLPANLIKHPNLQQNAFQQTPANVASAVKGSSASQCYIAKGKCVSKDDEVDARRNCKANEVVLGYAKSDCPVRSILSPKSLEWQATDFIVERQVLLYLLSPRWRTHWVYMATKQT